MKAPATTPRPAVKSNLPILVRDQYGDSVSSPALKVEVVVQKLEECAPRPSRAALAAYQREPIPNVPYQPTVKETMSFQAISMMKTYQNFSFEELRLASGRWGESCPSTSAFVINGCVPVERLGVRVQSDGSYSAAWTPRAPGVYVFRCMLDDLPVPQELTVEVAEVVNEGLADRCVQATGAAPSSPPSKLRRFIALFSAGLRVRASPSLQAEEIGRVPPGGNIGFVEEVVNKDGTWVRLSPDSVRAYAEGCAGVAWCLQHHRHLDKALLVPVEPSSPPASECASIWCGFGDLTGDVASWVPDEETVPITEDNCADERKFPISSICDPAMECDSASIPFSFGLEPSKRSRIARNEMSSPSPKRFQRRSNGNSEEWWSPGKQRCSDNYRDVNTILETDIEPEPEIEVEVEIEPDMEVVEKRSSGRLAQTGTQTSPDSGGDEAAALVHMFTTGAKNEILASPKSTVRERTTRHSCPSYKRTSSPPPLPARSAPAPPLPKKHAISPTQAECLRAIFAALLWHEGIVHDAIACAAFLKFHPQLPKQGARVVTRQPHEVPPPRHQRHSVEVSNAGQYLRIHPSTLESLTRSGVEASTSRMRKTDLDAPIREEEPQANVQPQPHTSTASTSPTIVNVLPPALRALVALWDALYDADQLASVTDKFRKDMSERNENEDIRPMSGIRKKRDWKTSTYYKSPYSVRCELCGGSSVPPPLAAHMRHAHAGCRSTTARGYDRAGIYRRADTPALVDTPATACGQLAQGIHQLWYIYCEKCREKALKAASYAKLIKTKTISEIPYERVETGMEVDHPIVKENALFLLELAPLNNSEPLSSSPWQESSGRSPPTPPGSVWQPAPPFQCLPALGAAPRATITETAARYHSLGRPPPPPAAPLSTTFNIPEPGASQWPRVHRSVSMGQAGGRDLANAAQPPLERTTHSEHHDTLSGAGSSLLSQPSTALQRLVGCGVMAAGCSVSAFEPPHLDLDTLINNPVFSFVLSKRDLQAYRQKMDAAIRINAVRQYAFEALNWLLRSATQPTCVHDVMWWFCAALDKYSRIAPPQILVDEAKESVGNENVRVSTPTACASAICPGGTSARGARAAFHAFLGSVSALAPSLPAASAAGLQAVRCWALHYSPHDRAFLHRENMQ